MKAKLALGAALVLVIVYLIARIFSGFAEGQRNALRAVESAAEPPAALSAPAPSAAPAPSPAPVPEASSAPESSASPGPAAAPGAAS